MEVGGWGGGGELPGWLRDFPVLYGSLNRVRRSDFGRNLI